MKMENWEARKMRKRDSASPQGLKPVSFEGALAARLEAVPFPKTIYERLTVKKIAREERSQRVEGKNLGDAFGVPF
jgi:hypothetical protein